MLFFDESDEEKYENDLLKNKSIITKLDMNPKQIKKYNKQGFKFDAIVIEKNYWFNQKYKT